MHGGDLPPEVFLIIQTLLHSLHVLPPQLSQLPSPTTTSYQSSQNRVCPEPRAKLSPGQSLLDLLHMVRVTEH
jgi:hypothetical protein